ncbi:MAG: DUF1707 domain-containing protein [Actinophytocola sp.]|nr:DUF1707 domain-containing protein [Actinophytocola sp.]
MRAGDSDRQAVADTLKQALDEGRLELLEYDERLQKTYAAKTYGDLSGLLDDLPGTVVSQRSQPRSDAAPQAAAPPPVSSSRTGQIVRAWLGGFGGIFVVCTVIWLATSIGSGHVENFWPVWLLIPMAFGVLGRIGRGNRT